jgi:nucleotide-binding universal stress UspA family protein
VTGDGPVLCAFDTSEPSLLAADLAAWLACALHAPLELLHVVDHGELPALPRSGAHADPEVRDALHELQERVAEHTARTHLEVIIAGLPQGEVTGSVLTGWPAAVIRRRASERGAVLLAAGTAGRSGVRHVLHGSVSGALAADAPCPVVVVAEGDALREPGPVLVGDDGSAGARRAVRHAQALAARLGCGLVHRHVEAGDPVDELARTARDQRACLVVAGTRGRGPLRTELFGSVSAGLVRTAGRPVVLVSERAGEPVRVPVR